MADDRTHHILSVLVENKAGVLARVAQPVRPARLQHLLARRRADRRRAVQPHHDRRRRRVVAARAGRQAAPQADQRGQDHRARPARLGRARADAAHGHGPSRPAATRSSSSCEMFGGRIEDVGHDELTDLGVRRARPARRPGRAAAPRTTSCRCSAPAASPCPASSGRRRSGLRIAG